MKIHDPTFEDLRKMDDLLISIKEKSFLMRICIRDKFYKDEKELILKEQLKQKKSIVKQLEELVRDWSYIPLCAECYRKEISITPYKYEPVDLPKMDDYLIRIQHEHHQLIKYEREAKNDLFTLRQIEDIKKTKLKLIKELRELTETWDYIPMCATELLKLYPPGTAGSPESPRPRTTHYLCPPNRPAPPLPPPPAPPARKIPVSLAKNPSHSITLTNNPIDLAEALPCSQISDQCDGTY